MTKQSDGFEQKKIIYSNNEQEAVLVDEERLRELLPIAKAIQERLKEVCNK